MRIITCASYYGVGSSSVTDFFSEFDGCASLGDYELRFAEEPYGISDLEYNLIENNHRHNTSHAIKKFIKQSEFFNGSRFRKKYRKIFGDDYRKYTDEYVDAITELKSKSWWHYDLIERGKFLCLLDFAIEKAHAKFISPVESRKTLFARNEIGYYSRISKEQFYEKTREYTNKLMTSANKSNASFMMVDQLVPPSNIKRYLNYFDDIKVIIVDRDPRDMFLLNKYPWREGIIPEPVEDFCEWYRITRAHRKEDDIDSEKVKFIRFEDMIYNYDQTTKELMDFVGISKEQHVRPKTVFKPEVSIKGTNLTSEYPMAKEEVEYVEKHLKEYLYPYEKMAEEH